MRTQVLLILLFAYAQISAAASSFKPARSPAFPLAVKSPYVNCWLPAGRATESGDPAQAGYLPGHWPVFWNGRALGWTGLIRVDGATYTWMGNPNPLPPVVSQVSFEYTATRSTFHMDVNGKVSATITFLSPLFPNDLKRQSLPFSYLQVDVASLDGAAHKVQLYTDITAEWVSGDRSAIAEWEYNVAPRGPAHQSSTQRRSRLSSRDGASQSAANNGNVAYHRFSRQTQLLWSETEDQTEYGNWYWATDDDTRLSHQSGSHKDLRNAFQAKGFLANTHDSRFRAINDSFPTFAFSKDLGSVRSSNITTLFTLGLAQEQAIQFNGASGNTSVPSLWKSYYEKDVDALVFFHNDFKSASALATKFDDQVHRDSIASGGENYSILTSLAARQAFGATQLCGTPDAPYLFQKEISSSGNVQTVDVIFPSHPILLYTNPLLLKLVLDPLFINQEARQYPNKYSMHDLGTHYPNATGHAQGNDEQQPLEECGNMLIMTLAYAQRANDIAYLHDHYDVLKQWTQYLIEEALIPANQISTDDFSGPLANQTNLALKGIIGIDSMARIAYLTGHLDESANYSTTAYNYISEWQILGIAHNANPPHTTLAYGMNDTHGLLYNLYADRELGLNLVPKEVYEMQSAFYPTVRKKYGVSLDTRHEYTKNDWQMFCAAIAGSETKSLFINDLVAWINETPTNGAVTDLYSTVDGNYPDIDFIARPVVGGWFSLLALKGF